MERLPEEPGVAMNELAADPIRERGGRNEQHSHTQLPAGTAYQETLVNSMS